MTGDPVPCPDCGATDTRVAWSRASIWKAAVNAVLLPAWMISGYFGDMRGWYFRLDRRCDRCGARLAWKGLLPRPRAAVSRASSAPR